MEEALRSAAFTQVTRGGPGRTQEDGPPPAGVGTRVGAPPLAPGKASQLRTAPRARHAPASPPLAHPSRALASPSHCPPNSRGAAPLPAPPCSPPWGPSPATPDPSVGPSVSAERPAPGRPSREARPRAHPSTRVRGPGGPGGTARATPRPAEPCGPGASADPPCKEGSAFGRPQSALQPGREGSGRSRQERAGRALGAGPRGGQWGLGGGSWDGSSNGSAGRAGRGADRARKLWAGGRACGSGGGPEAGGGAGGVGAAARAQAGYRVARARVAEAPPLQSPHLRGKGPRGSVPGRGAQGPLLLLPPAPAGRGAPPIPGARRAPSPRPNASVRPAPRSCRLSARRSGPRGCVRARVWGRGGAGWSDRRCKGTGL